MEPFVRLRELGRGAYGTAWLVHPADEPGRLLVAKETPLPVGDAGALAAARHEAALLAACAHPNIVRAYGSAVVEPSPDELSGGGGGCDVRRRFVLYQEFADGGDVAGLIARRRAANGVVTYVPEATVLSIVAQLCLALDHLHAHRIMHRDLKPSNVFLTSSGLVKLGDFGVARRLESAAQLAATMIGTPFYLSPELAQGRPYGRKADMWAVGVLAHELCSGAPPFNAPDVPALLRRICAGRVPRLPPAARYSKGLDALVASLLARDPRTRPSARQVLATEPVRSTLRALLAATTATTLAAGALALTSPPPLALPLSPSPPPLPRPPRSAVAATAALPPPPLAPAARHGAGAVPPAQPPRHRRPLPTPPAAAAAAVAVPVAAAVVVASPDRPPVAAANCRERSPVAAAPAGTVIAPAAAAAAGAEAAALAPRPAPTSPAARARLAAARLHRGGASALHDAVAAERARRAAAAEQQAAALAAHAAAERRDRKSVV